MTEKMICFKLTRTRFAPEAMHGMFLNYFFVKKFIKIISYNMKKYGVKKDKISNINNIKRERKQINLVIKICIENKIKKAPKLSNK